MPTGPGRGQESHAYLGMSLLLSHKAVSRHPELGHTCVPQIFDQCPDGVCLGNVVRSTADTQTQAKQIGALGELAQHRHKRLL